MSKTRITLKVLTFMVFTLALSALAQAQATRTWVSGVGDDVNPCSRTAPCKTFAGAISKTAANGEISVLDPGGYGTLTITKGITVDGGTGAGWASTLAAGTSGFIVNDSLSGTPNTIIVTLRNISINGATTGSDGVRFIAGKALHIENCQIFQFRGQTTGSHGVDIALTAAATGGHRVVIKDTIIRENGGDGIFASNTAVGGAVNVLVENSHISQNNNGITSSTASKFVVTRSVFSTNAVTNVGAGAGSAGIDLDSCVMQGGTNGLAIVAGTHRMSNCYITNNTNGVNFAGGTLVTYGDNRLAGNTNEATGGVIPPATNKK